MEQWSKGNIFFNCQFNIAIIYSKFYCQFANKIRVIAGFSVGRKVWAAFVSPKAASPKVASPKIASPKIDSPNVEVGIVSRGGSPLLPGSPIPRL